MIASRAIAYVIARNLLLAMGAVGIASLLVWLAVRS